MDQILKLQNVVSKYTKQQTSIDLTTVPIKSSGGRSLVDLLHSLENKEYEFKFFLLKLCL